MIASNQPVVVFISYAREDAEAVRVASGSG